MKHRRFVIWISGLALVVLAAVALLFRLRPEKHNILLITLDTTRADRLGCYGDASAVTPTLDSLAKRGVLFERAYAPAPMTGPSHASMFTGLFPPEHGVWTHGGTGLAADVPVLAEMLRSQGHGTAAFVSAAVLTPTSGLSRGFEYYNDELSAVGGELDGDGHSHGFSRDGKHTVDAALKWLTGDKSSQEPFFCWVHLFDPHHPYLPHRDEFGDKFADRPYDAEIAYVDLQLSRLFAALDKQGILDQTVVVVVGDHGESLGEHGERRHGYMLHDSTLRVPLIIAVPRGTASGSRVSTPVSLVDLFPTLLTLGGVRPPAACADRDLALALKGQLLSPRICYSQTLEPYQEARWSPLRSLTTERWRYVKTAKPELYDLQADPAELQNLAAERPEIASDLEDELAAFFQGLKPHSGNRDALSAAELRSLESLGYVGGTRVEPGQLAFDQSGPDIKDRIDSLNRLFDARSLMEQQEFQRAAELLEPIAETIPNFLRAYYSLGVCHFQEGKMEAAARWFQAVLETDPNYEPAHDVLGFIYLKLRQLDSAEEHFQRVLDLNPASENAHLYLGEIAQRQENFQLAMQFYAETLRINPRNRQAREALDALQQAGIRF